MVESPGMGCTEYGEIGGEAARGMEGLGMRYMGMENVGMGCRGWGDWGWRAPG